MYPLSYTYIVYTSGLYVYVYRHVHVHLQAVILSSSHPGGCHIIFLPLNSVPELSKKAKFKNLFDIAYFSNRYVYMKTGCAEQMTHSWFWLIGPHLPLPGPSIP